MQEIKKEKTKSSAGPFFLVKGLLQGVFKKAVLHVNGSHIKWFILKSPIRHLYLYINPHVAVNRDAPCTLACEVSEKSVCKEQSSSSTCWGSGRWKRESPYKRSHVPFLMSHSYFLEASKRILFFICFKNENTLTSYVFFLRTEGIF